MPPDEARLAIDTLDDDPRRILKCHGIAAIKVAKQKRYKEGAFQWHSDAPDPTDSPLTWYIDGSVMNPTMPQLLTTGFAIVVVDAVGSLVAFGSGIPPDYVLDSGGTETWALQIAIAACVALPNIVTDCLGLLDLFAAGESSATAGNSSNART